MRGRPFTYPKKDERSVVLMRERFEQRLFRIFAQTGYSPVQLLTITPEEMVEIPGITVPNIRAVLCVQNKVLADRNKVRSGKDILAARRGCFISDLNLSPILRRAALLDLCRMEKSEFPLSQWQDTVRYLTGVEKDFASIEEIKAFLRNEVKL